MSRKYKFHDNDKIYFILIVGQYAAPFPPDFNINPKVDSNFMKTILAQFRKTTVGCQIIG